MAHKRWADIDRQAAEQKLISVLYKVSNAVADASGSNLFDPDAQALADAFKSTLDLKHDHSIVLPSHLHEKVPKKLRQYLSDASDL